MRAASNMLVILAAAAFSVSPALAQERLVVTGARIADEIGEYVIPHVGVTQRADYLLRTVFVFNDTRDEEQRLTELRATLNDMLANAENDEAIELATIVTIDAGRDEIVTPFVQAHVDGAFRSNYGGRTDTSYIELVVKTPITDDDALPDAVARIAEFVDGVERIGRSELDLQRNDRLSVVDPGQYRDAVFEAMSADASARLETLGEDYRARFEGLENPIEWYRADVLDIRLFIPHRFSIEPSGG